MILSNVAPSRVVVPEEISGPALQPRESDRGGARSTSSPDGEPSWAAIYGLISEYGELTLEQVGVAFDLSREGVRQIERGAIEKLRRACTRQGLELRDLFPGGGQ